MGMGVTLKFLDDTNLGLEPNEEPLASALNEGGFVVENSTDLVEIDKDLFAHRPDVAHIPAADLFRLIRKGDTHYRGLAQATSKFTGSTRLRSLLLVHRDDPANSIDDLEGATFGVLNRSCSTTFFSPWFLLNPRGKRFDRFAELVHVEAGPGWQNIPDGVIGGHYRATMLPEDVIHSAPDKKARLKVIGEYEGALPGVIVARRDLDEKVRRTLLQALIDWRPDWDALYGPFKPFAMADLHSLFHDASQLPSDLFE